MNMNTFGFGSNGYLWILIILLLVCGGCGVVDGIIDKLCSCDCLIPLLIVLCLCGNKNGGNALGFGCGCGK